ncbi:PIN domain-containing protein [Anaerolinea thermophila]|uniref:PIN domain-containing protein n=1 Tax=Anaerolinea thermophila TaxID=167964 RepID=UPI0009D6429D|nr:PIN domain-containing protein [Anaerolinea thermophila]
MNTPPKVFLDTSVIFAAVLSPEGGERMVFRLGESRLVHLWIGGQVLKECEAVILRKAADSLPNMALLLDTAKVQIGAEASPTRLEHARQLVAYPPDAIVLAEAIESQPDWFLTHDHQHFLKGPTEELSFRVGTPGDFLRWFRENIVRQD